MKPLYYAIVDEVLYFASEAKALLPFVASISTDVAALRDYLAFQFCLDGKTLFAGISELPAGHCLEVANGSVTVRRFWEVFYDLDWNHTGRYFEEQLRGLLGESIRLHLRADVPVGAYLSGGLDSSIVATAARRDLPSLRAYTGRIAMGPEFDESAYARAVAEAGGMELFQVDITATDFVDNIRSVIYHLDYPVAGPGALSQYIVARLAAEHDKVVLGGQGGDEVFGGYARYLIAYFEQCIRAAIDGTMHNGNFVVSYESIIPNLETLRNYKPLLQEFWRDGLFDEMDLRYFRLVNRSTDVGDEVRWELLGDYSPLETFRDVFNAGNIRSSSYFDRMTHFDFKTLLPALLQVEDRVSMAHSLESRLPLLDHPLVELAATIPADTKFANGELKRVLRTTFGELLPPAVLNRKDKMGFPTPITQWANGEAREFILDVLCSPEAQSREFFDNRQVVERMTRESRFGRTFWGLLSLELWQQQFHDRSEWFRSLVASEEVVA